MPNSTIFLRGRAKVNRSTFKLTIALDIGKNTGYAIAFHPQSGINKFIHGSGNPFEVSEIIKLKSKICKNIHFLFYYEEVWKNQRTTNALKRYKRIIIDPFLFSYPEIKISLFNKNEITNQFLGSRPDPKEKKEKILLAVRKSKFKNIDNYDESDALMLLIWFIREKSLIIKEVL